MKKIIFLLSIMTILTACSSERSAEKDPNVLPDGIMQPVAGTGAMEGGGFIPTVEQSDMPDNMK
ncbi:hypothetical protein CBG46_02485 [Actinobacillus succinogenes]|uniref:Type IV secretion system putative lipoprotein virB7 n=1 Tax=Actinobacillus succinogenes (strain ATCC 55618 / DSM 22257 / CCUG 43843 / 130Z) TaxID=339671 RepID=A6VLT8_ACTSZ|nr:membrane lipoprotein lipid attachment site-containing protein [Actinobacillus succinogenes]ABR73935.1 conserved hypothetical protein [Actinobacillus succinogenes 130Z]PHI39619.1 hypothetical protein CBG46_02485 [Actinobacillus succinogenes]